VAEGIRTRLTSTRSIVTIKEASSGAGEPWGRRLWLSLAAVLLVAIALDSYGIASWPMADDEVPTLVELGLQRVEAAAFSVPSVQLERLPRALPIYYAFQGFALRFFPHNELGFRLPSLICAILTCALIFIVAARWRGLWFATALALFVNGSQTFVYLSQIDRFYAMPLLLLTITLIVLWLPGSGAAMIAATIVLALVTILSHNVAVAVFVLTFLAAAAAFVIGRAPLRVVLRSGAAAAISVVTYFSYIRPLVAGWHSTGNPTPVLISFVAHAGVPTLALALAGCWLALSRPDRESPGLWCALMLTGSLCFLQFTGMTWNPRYFLFFMPPMWLLAAEATAFIANRVGYRGTGLAWYGVVVLMLLPNLFSHFQDGSRHNYREAAAVLRANAHGGEPILSDDAETISYYLPADLRQGLSVRTKAKRYPSSDFYLVTRANAWTPLPQIPGRQMQLLAEIYRRRVDQFSHILRVYRVTAGSAD
jgi:hypothetical protein